MRDACPLMIFAAGFGTRMGALTANRPKPLLKVAGKTLLDRAIDIGEQAGCSPIVANTHYLAEAMHASLATRDVAISHEDQQILDTGGGLKHALGLTGEGIVATLNPDAAWIGPNPVSTLLDTGLPDEADALLLLVPEERALSRATPGDFSLSQDGRLSRRGRHVYTGAQLVRSHVVARIPESVFSMNTVWDALETEGRLYGIVYEGDVIDVGTPEGLTLANTRFGEEA